MANFTKSVISVPVFGKTTITMLGGGPPPANLALDIRPDNPGLVSATRTATRLGPEYDWEITGKFPGKTLLQALIPGTASTYSAPLEVVVTGRITIKFSANGEGTMTCVGLGNFKVLGQPGRQYPKDITVDPNADPTVKKTLHHSKEFNVDMPFAIRIWGQMGIFIHEFPDNLSENGGPSAGCIHVGKPNSKRVFDYIVTRTRITIEYPW
ncbi:MAG: L,D-transpeptidase [Acidobacteriota bacterium]